MGFTSGYWKTNVGQHSVPLFEVTAQLLPFLIIKSSGKIESASPISKPRGRPDTWKIMASNPIVLKNKDFAVSFTADSSRIKTTEAPVSQPWIHSTDLGLPGPIDTELSASVIKAEPGLLKRGQEGEESEAKRIKADFCLTQTLSSRSHSQIWREGGISSELLSLG